jgi:hypothetical protein
MSTMSLPSFVSFGSFSPRAWAVCVVLLASPKALQAEPALCLTGNSNVKELNQRPVEAGYRYVWAGTNQPCFPAEQQTSGWVSFAEGLLCDGQNYELPFHAALREKCGYTSYDWPNDGYELDIDLGQVCEIARLSLSGAKRLILKGYSEPARRWIPLAAGANELSVQGFQARRFRVEVAGRFAEMTIWGRLLDAKATPMLPPALAPQDPNEPFAGLKLKPSEQPSFAPDPFVFPQPQEMSFTDKLLELPKQCPLVLPAQATPSVRGIAETLSEHAGVLVNLDLKPGAEAEGPSVWMGLATDAGIWAEAGKRHKLGAEEIAVEGYAVEVTENRVALVGRDERGLYYATRTFLLLLQARKEGAAVPVGHVRDFPRAEIRPAFAFQGWEGPFKRRLAAALATLKYSYLVGGEPQKVVMERNYLKYFVGGQLFPQSRCGTDGDLLEALPGIRAQALNLARLSGCCSHPDFWKGMAASWEREMQGWEGNIVDVGYDEIFHNPFDVCARCRARGISAQEMLLDAYMKAYRCLTKRGFQVSVLVTGFRQFKPFDMFVDIPRDSILVNYAGRAKENQELKDLGFRVIGGSTGPVRIQPDSPLHSGIVWNWGSEHPAAMFGDGQIRSQTIVAEENWSSANKPEWRSPLWQARLNRAIDFLKHIVNVVPLPVPGVEHRYFALDISSRATRPLKDEAFGDGAGWLDEGPSRDLRHLPTGQQTLKGIPYLVGTAEKAAIIVAGPGASDAVFPDQVTDIPINRKAGELYFLHACAARVWTSLGRRVMLVGFYRIRYEDGSFVTAEVNYGQHVGEWLRSFGYRKIEVEPTEEPLPDATVAWRGGTDGGYDVTLYSMPWRNPYPDKAIAAVDVLASAQTESNGNRLCLLAVSGREPEEGDHRSVVRLAERPEPRPYRPRPPLPEGVEAVDMTRRTPPPLPVPIAYVTEWQTTDRWFSAKIEIMASQGSPYYYEKSETNRGPYSALDPDDDAWRCAPIGDTRAVRLTVTFKRHIELYAIGVKGIMQRIRDPGLFPVDIEAYVLDKDFERVKVGEVKGHVGQEGEERWVFDNPIKATGVEIRQPKGSGISAVYLYAKKGAVPPPRFKLTKIDKSETAIGEERTDKEKATDEDVVDEFEGTD